jgi:delta24-sterol reductase
MGGGIESTSHKYGLFHHICTQYEVVTSDGECVLANLEVNPDIFHALPFSYGTLGFLTSVTIRIVAFKPYLKVTYRPTKSLEETCRVFERETYK